MSRFWNPPKNATQEHFGDQFGGLALDSKVLASRLPPISSNEVGEPLTVPIYQSSVYKNTSVQQYLNIIRNGGYIYQRLGNPTTETAELIINELEGGAGSIVYNSGLAAICSMFLNFLKQGDHIVCQSPCYSGTGDFIKKTLSKFGVSVTWVAGGSPIQVFQDALQQNTKVCFMSTQF